MINNNQNRLKFKEIILFLCLICLVSIFLSGAVSASNITVTPSSGIQNAINKAHNGDTLNLASGTYNEHDILVNKNLIISGPKKISSTPTAVVDAKELGSVFHISNGFKVTLKNLLIKNGDAYDGGGIWNEGNLIITNCSFQRNNAEDGGAVRNDYGTSTITECTFSYNNANDEGGAISNDGTCTVDRCTFIGNSAIYGGAILTSDPMDITKSSFTSNTAEYGGAIYNYVSQYVTVSKSTFKSNHANNEGGAIYITDEGYNGVFDDASLYVDGSTFLSNTARSGGAIFSTDNGANEKGTYLSIRDSTFSNNSAVDDGGAIYNDDLSTIYSSNIINNKVNAADGGTIFNGGDLKLNFCRIVGNTPYAIYNNIEFAGDSIDATNNWWGSNDPNIKVYGVNIWSWLVLKVNVNPSIIRTGSTSLINANLLYDSFGSYQDPKYDHIPNGLIITFKTSRGSITSSKILNQGVVTNILKAGSTQGIATIQLKLDNQIIYKTVTIKNIPKILSTLPTNLKTGVSRISTITIKFNEKILKGTYFNYITIKNLSTGKTTPITRTLLSNSNNLYLKTNSTRSAYTWYLVTIPAKAIKNYYGNNLTANYTFKFKTGS